MKKIRTFFALLKKTFTSWNTNDPWAESAIIAYYTIFSLPSLLIIVVSIAGSFFGREAVQGRLNEQIEDFIGADAAEAVEKMVTSAAITDNSTWAIIFGIAMLLFGATGVFFRLKISMNKIWNVAAKKETFMRMIMDRLISFGMILAIGFLMLLALIVSALVKILGEYIEDIAPVITAVGLNILNYILSFIFITALFGAIFKLLPDIKIKLKITLYGAALTTVLFLIGEFLMGFYFGQSNPGSVYGSASSIILILLWVNYTCLIMFFGAEFTVQYALHKNERIRPNRFSEPAIFKELEKLERKNVKLDEDHKLLARLRANIDIEKERAECVTDD
ncbi:YihY/virulence factor BrkB family protein [Antarcticibacterium arcticum]|uniref:YihY/virulence factor BrkB family protein n=1 Tax=Antarcticibacterium arcticum TaxID=2585771 RepID=A0A5B8YMT7_9FLAO|nr:YihY/virulence factor BrkB family protein [Antarcticibacterium arcticum]QED37069.1 YihY/virulence factor BrkB family protein [Antarcticibacterium arcticum]